ncbi:DEAD/DEAH box helicase [uncultured Treponema sp.]|uniref:DEAD/DEAH box helicase n=1 Tax=uncultured Treponema sp. TaxID=162155 RepID=UPI00258E78F5|nr:DEAD/DEAH box helicase [uncultured Treponema sp.]
MKFTEFSLHESLLQGIEGAGYVDCTPVQEQVLKSSLEGRDLYVQSQTGTGKTAAYLTSVIQELLTRGESAGKKALVMVPTRELAVQVQEEAQKLAKFTSLKCASFYGGVGYDKQVASLKKGVDIMIGTPGRVIDLNHGNQMDLSSVAFLVIDEADRMFDMGFYPDLRTLIKVLPSSEQRQTMLFSATLNSYVKNLAWEYTRNPAEITIAAENITVDEIAQELFHVSSDDKMKLLLGIISHEKPESLIVFCNTKKSCEIVAKRLKMNGFESEFIIGDLPQKKRLTIMDKFKAGAIKCLVATDVAARGIDVNDLAMVINYDLPNEAENYVHRIGRTARAGKSGKAFTFCSEQDVYSLPPIERYIEKSIPSCVADESMFAEDKSAGVYIKLDSYHEDYNDKSEFGRRRAAEYNRKNGNSDRRRSSKKGRGRYSSRNEEAKKEYKRDRRVYIDEDKLASMSTEERMKIYKEKYASFASGSSSNKQKISTKKQGVAKKNSSVQKNASGKKNYSSKSAESKKTPQKKSVFARIKSFFGKK